MKTLPTTIKLKRSTAEALFKMKRYGETYDDLITDMLLELKRRPEK